MTSFLERLSAVCREFPLREKIVVAPSLAIGHQVGDALARAGTPWINLRFETTRTIADSVAGLELARLGVTVLSRAQALALVEAACDAVFGPSSYFAPLAGRPGLHRAIQKSLDDLRGAGVDAARLRRSAFEDEGKRSDLARVLEVYQRELAARGYVDRPGVLDAAIDILERGAVPRADCLWLVMEGLELSAREERLVAFVSGGRAETLSAVAAVPARPPLFRRGVGEENEIRGVFRSLAAARETLDDAELVYTTRDPYLSLAFELSSEYALPCTFAEGVPVHFTRSGQSALAFLRWIGEGWHAAELQRFAGAKVRRTLRRAAVGWGRDRYLPRIDAWIAGRQELLEDEENESRRAAVERSIDDARAARLVVEELLAITAEVASSFDVASASRAAASFLRRRKPQGEVDLMAREGLVRMFTELASVETGLGSRPGREEVSARLAEAVSGLHVAASNPRPGHLHVAAVPSGGWSGRRRVFVVGLDEDRHPGRGLQDPILLDVEREAIGMPISGDRPRRTSLQFTRFLGRCAPCDVTLSWPSLRLRDRRELFPSTALLDVFRNTTPGAGYEELTAAAAEERFVDPTPLSASEWWLMRRFSGEEDGFAEAVLASYPALADGARAEAARAGDAITPYDGKVSATPEELDPRLNGRTYSASQLEQMASCPFRYFLERVLGVAPLEELVFDPDNWLDAREFGSMLHEVLEKAMKELTASRQPPSLAFLPRMEEIAKAALESWRELVPPPGETAFQRRERELLRSCAVFLRSEEGSPRDVSPAHFEYGFDDFRMPLGRGRSITLRGFIDRIDRHRTRDEWHVWDYKSGLSKDYEGDWSLRCGTKMQHALYARAVEAKLGGKVTRSGYFFPTTRGRGARVEPQCGDAELRKALNLLSDVVGSGWFPHADVCRWCDFEEVCGTAVEGGERTQAKSGANADDPAVAAWLALKEVR